jgi:4-diphosphocytidyl-2-C-methyl-D-erythritol kinase
VIPSGAGLSLDAPAKVNLFLRILAREDSGYHQLETLFCALELADTLTVRRGGGDIELTVEGADLGDARGNLVYRAADAYFAAAGLTPRVRIALQKRIPHGAGLGGGSSDAAATLRLLDRLHDGLLGTDRLLRIAITLGADVPFFVAGTPCALAWGRGERLLALPAPERRHVVIIVPDTPISTPHAYAELARRRRPGAAPPAPACMTPEELGEWNGITRRARNDFEPIAFETVPELRAARARLGGHGGAPVLLSGSGSAMFAVFADPGAAALAAADCQAAHPAWRVLETASATAAAAG